MASAARQYAGDTGTCVWTYTPGVGGAPGIWTSDDSGCKDGCYCIDDFAPSASLGITDLSTTRSASTIKVKRYTVDDASFRSSVARLIASKPKLGLAPVPSTTTGGFTYTVPCAR